MRNLLALLLFVPSLCLAQLPDYVPTNSLVGWYPFDGNPSNAASELYDSAPQNNFTYVEQDSRFFIRTEGSGAGIGTAGGHILFPEISIPSFDEFTISGWVRTIEVLYIHGESYFSLGRSPLEFSVDDNSNMSEPTILTRAHGEGVEIDALPTIGIWNHWCASIGTDTTRFYLNGELVDTRILPSSLSSMEDVFGLGIHWWQGGVSTRLSADFDDFGIWNRALNSAEVMALHTGTPTAYGCTYTLACNYDETANTDDGSCISCEVLASACGEGTVWDSTLAQCISIAPPCASSCGEGTVWDPVNEECIIAIPADINYDGCVTVNDLLILLAVHGTCPPYPEWPDEPTDTTWTCGDPVTFWDYDYTTVLIGEQCWFAENLRAALYANGDVIPAGLTDGEWTTTTAGATAVYGEGSSTCYNYSPDIDACDEAQSLAEYGRLYNWYAVDDARGLCPAGWHVPTDGEWTDLEVYITSQGFTGTEGTALKSTTGWSNNGNGTDDFGFSALPGGYRYNGNGNFRSAGSSGYWWSSSPGGGDAWYRELRYSNPVIFRYSLNPRLGFSVRCLRDAE